MKRWLRRILFLSVIAAVVTFVYLRWRRRAPGPDWVPGPEWEPPTVVGPEDEAEVPAADERAESVEFPATTTPGPGVTGTTPLYDAYAEVPVPPEEPARRVEPPGAALQAELERHDAAEAATEAELSAESEHEAAAETESEVVSPPGPAEPEAAAEELRSGIELESEIRERLAEPTSTSSGLEAETTDLSGRTTLEPAGSESVSLDDLEDDATPGTGEETGEAAEPTAEDAATEVSTDASSPEVTAPEFETEPLERPATALQAEQEALDAETAGVAEPDLPPTAETAEAVTAETTTEEEASAEAAATTEPGTPAETPTSTDGPAAEFVSQSFGEAAPVEEAEPSAPESPAAADSGALGETLEEALTDVRPEPVSARRDAESYLDEGNVYFNVGQYGLAIDRYTQALEADPQLTAGYYNRANARTRAGEYDAALGDYDRALELAPEDADALNNRGMLHLYRGNFAAALRDFNSALRVDPTDSTVMVNRGLAYLHGGDATQALADFRRAAEADSEDAAAHYGAGQASAALGNRADALASLRRAMEIDPAYAREAAADPRLSTLQGDQDFMRLLRDVGSRAR